MAVLKLYGSSTGTDFGHFGLRLGKVLLLVLHKILYVF